MNTSEPTISKSATPQLEDGDPIIHHILQAVGSRVHELKNNISTSQELLKLGVDTNLTTELRNLLKDPLSKMLSLRVDIDNTISELLTFVITRYFKNHEDIIEKAFRTDTGKNDLHFSIVLKNDNFENREIIFNLLRDYKYSTDLWDLLPLYIQFIPIDLVEKIKNKEDIIS